jgi:lycopene beta-cyclase
VFAPGVGVFARHAGLDGVVAEVLVIGAGPAGWAAAHACAMRGLETVLVAPEPHARWPATYGIWGDETRLLPAGSRWVEASTRVFALTEHQLPRRYAVLDNGSVHTALSHPEVRTVSGRVSSIVPGSRGCAVNLDSGRVLAAAVVIDASGAAPSRVEQTAFGLILPGHTDEAMFMDWRVPPGFDPSTFRYSVPLPGDRMLVEETSLARQPGLSHAELRRRLAARGITSGTVERVRIPMDLPVPPRRPGVVPFGAAAALVHPATGYSCADTFRLAPRLAEAIASTLPHGPASAVRAACHEVWPPAARLVHSMRRRGLAVLLALPPHRIPEFFELFFGLPAELQLRYLGRREDVRGTAAAMAMMFRSADRTLRVAMARHAFAPKGLR